MLAELQSFVTEVPTMDFDEWLSSQSKEFQEKFIVLSREEKNLEKLKETHLFEIESQSVRLAEQRVQKARSDFSQDELGQLLQARLAKYPKLNLDFLGSFVVDKEFKGLSLTLPRFAVFSPNSSYFSAEAKCLPLHDIKDISFSFSGNNFQSFAYVPIVFEEYLGSTLLPTLKKLSKFANFPHVRVEFQGFIPASAKKSINRAVNECFSVSRLFIISEVTAENWLVLERRPDPLDPLVVAFYGDDCYLIDSFNITPLEEYIKDEFTFQ